MVKVSNTKMEGMTRLVYSLKALRTVTVIVRTWVLTKIQILDTVKENSRKERC